MGRLFDVGPRIEAEGGRSEEEERLDEDAARLFEIDARSDELKWRLFVDDETPFGLEMWRFELLPHPFEEDVYRSQGWRLKCLPPQSGRR